MQELATEIVLTLGEAFEVAYQVAVQRCAAPHNQLDSGCVFATTSPPAAFPPPAPAPSPDRAVAAPAGWDNSERSKGGGVDGGGGGKKQNRRSLLISNAACPAPQLRL